MSTQEVAAGDMIYKILTEELWFLFRQSGRFEGAPVDLADGYIHFSTARQVRETAARHFAGVTGLVLLVIDTGRLGSPLRWEPARGGDLFPHLYAPLAMDAVLDAHPLPLGPDGAHAFPDDL
jgi:uncharacterized protein (DUF952 family)